MKIKEYERQNNITLFDLFPIETISGTRSTAIDDIYWSMANVMSLPNRRFIYRGKNLGSSFTYDQKKAIREGNFDDLFIGDYWEVSDITDPVLHLPIKWRIVDLDYGYETQRTSNGVLEKCLTHHLIIMPDSVVAGPVAFDSTGAKPYGPSQLRNALHYNELGVTSMIDGVFGLKNDGSSRIVYWYHAICDAVDTNGISTTMFNGVMKIDLPDTSVLFGQTNNPSWQSSTPLSGSFNLSYKPFGQFSLMTVNCKQGISTANNSYYLLQDIIGKNTANNHLYSAAIGPTGFTNSADTSTAGSFSYVRPMFAIGGEE